MNEFLVTLIGAIAAILLMPLGLWLIPTFKLLSPMEQARAFGSFFGGGEAQAASRGIAVAVFFGLLWAFVYAAIWSLIDNKELIHYVILGVLSGAFFGENVSLTTVLVFTDNHPIARFQDQSWKIALGTVTVHIVHGLVFGLIAGYAELDYGFISKVIIIAP